jgi:hypothetical protein
MQPQDHTPHPTPPSARNSGYAPGLQETELWLLIPKQTFEVWILRVRVCSDYYLVIHT